MTEEKFLKPQDKKIGKTFAMLRKSKKLTLKEVTGAEFSESQASKFEKGESELTISKFFTLLENSNIFLDEFRDVYNNYTDSELHLFSQKLAEAHSEKSRQKVKQLIKFWQEKTHEEPAKTYYHLNLTVTECVLSYITGSKVLEENIDYLMEYLDNVEEWGRYELWLFGNCLIFFDDNMLDYYGKIILGKTDFYKNVPHNQRMVLRTFLNLVDAWLQKGNLQQALKYINHLKDMKMNFDFLAERIMLSYHEGHYQYLFGNENGKNIMKKAAQTLEDYGFERKAEAMFKEIENL